MEDVYNKIINSFIYNVDSLELHLTGEWLLQSLQLEKERRDVLKLIKLAAHEYSFSIAAVPN